MTDDYQLLMSPQMLGLSLDACVQTEPEVSEAPETLREQPRLLEHFNRSTYSDLIIQAHQHMMQNLCAELLGYIHVQSHGFFEALVIDLVLALGYGGRRRDLARRLGRSGDGGVDGIIEMDELGLDMIYVQAKRLKPASTVPVSAVRDFVGSLDAHHAVKGIFVTTGNFTAAAHSVVRAVSKKVVLIDGRRLTELMVRHNFGVVPSTTFPTTILPLPNT